MVKLSKLSWPRVIHVLSACVFFFELSANAAGVLIPLPNPGKSELKAPAVDLVRDDRTPIDRDEVVDLIRAGQDVSLFDPQNSDIWKQNALPASNEDEFNYPAEGSIINYDSDLPRSSGLIRSRVSSADGRPFHIIMSLGVHGALARSALLRKLGYTISSPKHYRSLTLRFPTQQIRDRFLDALSNETLADRKRWVTGFSEQSLDVTFQDLVLEPGRIQTPAYHWGAMDPSHIKGRRVLRALLIPLVLLDLSDESINLYSWEIGKVLSNNLSLTHPYADAFGEITYEDARWITRKLAQLTRKDFEEIAVLSRFPQPITAIVVEKLLARRNQLIALLDLAHELPKNIRKLNVNSNISLEPSLKKGKIYQERFEGHAERFTFGDPKSPLKKEEIARYILQESLASGMKAAATKLNELLILNGPEKIAKAHQENVLKSFLEHIQKNPGMPFERPIEAWAGPTGSLEVNASRNLITGSYYGSDSMLQLIDNIGAQASVGFFMGVDGLLEQGMPSVSGNVYVQRNYLHIRPVSDTKTALKTNWTWLWIPNFMHSFGNFLEPEECRGIFRKCHAVIPADQLEAATVSKNLDKFFSELKEGEILMITDTLGSGLSGRVTLPISALVNADLSGTSGSLSFGAQGQAQILRKTTISRTKEGLQVYIQHANIEALGFTFDFNFWIKLFRSSFNLRKSAADVRAYLIGQKPEAAADQRKMIIALNALFKGNNSELLEASYPFYKLEHKMPSNAWRARILPWSWTRLEEGHRLRVTPPEDPQKRYMPEEFERFFFTHRILRKNDRNLSKLLTDLSSAIFSSSDIEIPGSQDASTSLLGRSHWTSILSEAETTPGKESIPFTLVEHHWQGPVIFRGRFFKVLDEIESRLKFLKLTFPLFNRDFFVNLKRLELYDIQSNLLIYDRGLKILRDQLLAKKAESDQALYRFLIDIDGNRDEFLNWCAFELNRRLPDESGDLETSRRKARDLISGRDGWIYDCMKPWMSGVFQSLRKFPKNAEAQVKWTAEFVQNLERNLDLGRFLDWLGRDNFYFQVRISGFRNGQEDGDNNRMAGQRHGDSDYLSSTIGTVDPEAGLGPLKSLIGQSGLSSYEVYARYLSEAQ